MGTTLVSARFVRCGCGATITPEQAVNARLVWPELCRECAGHVRTYIPPYNYTAHRMNNRRGDLTEGQHDHGQTRRAGAGTCRLA